MKKIAFFASAIAAAAFGTAHADISVSGSAKMAYVDASGNTEMQNGGGVSFGMSTTTDAGVSISASAGISGDADSAGSGTATSGLTSIAFGFSNGSITIGDDVGVADGVGKVGELVGHADTMNVTTSYIPGIIDDEGSGIAASTSVGDMSLGIVYNFDGGGSGDIDGATTTNASVKLSMPVGGATLTAAHATSEITGSDSSETGVALSYGVGGGTLTLGFTGVSQDDTDKEGESYGVAYSTTVNGLALGVGLQSSEGGSSKETTTTDVTLSSPLGGGASIFAEYRSISGNGAGAESATASKTVLAVGTSVSF
jgi:hypothetical protein